MLRFAQHDKNDFFNTLLEYHSPLRSRPPKRFFAQEGPMSRRNNNWDTPGAHGSVKVAQLDRCYPLRTENL